MAKFCINFNSSFDQTHIQDCIMHEFKNFFSARETNNICPIYWNETLSVWTCQRWSDQFQVRNCFLEKSSHPQSRQRSSVNIELLLTVGKILRCLNLVTGSLIIWLLHSLISKFPSAHHWRVNLLLYIFVGIDEKWIVYNHIQ